MPKYLKVLGLAGALAALAAGATWTAIGPDWRASSGAGCGGMTWGSSSPISSSPLGVAKVAVRPPGPTDLRT